MRIPEIPVQCAYCRSTDLTSNDFRGGVRLYCVECEATAIIPHGSEPMWTSGRTMRRFQAAVADADRRFESD